MALDITNKTIHTSYKVAMGNDQQKAVAKLYAEKGHSIAKILCANVVVCNHDTEVLNSEARYQSKLRFEVLYLGEDGNFYTISDMTELTGRISNQLFHANMVPLTTSNVIDTQITSLQADMVELTSIVDTNIDVIANDAINFVERANSRVVAKVENFEYCTLVNNQKTRFKVTDEFELKENVGRLLMASAHICNEEVTPGTGYVTVKGTTHLNLIYETEGEVKELRNISRKFDFKEELDAPNVTPTSLLSFVSNVMNDEINVLGNNVDGKTTLKTSAMLCYTIAARNKEQSEAVVDAFSLDNNINLTIESFYKCQYSDVMVANKNLTSTTVLEDNVGEIEAVEAHCGGNVFVANAYAKDGAVIVEGIVHADVIYISPSSEEELKYESTVVEIPFAVELPNEQVSGNTLVAAETSIKNMVAKRKRSRELEIELELCMYIQLTETMQETVVGQIVETAPQLGDDIALKMFVMRKGSTLWDASKHMNASPEMIMEQNPNVVFPLKEDTVLIIYKQKE